MGLFGQNPRNKNASPKMMVQMDIIFRPILLLSVAFVRFIIAFGRTRSKIPFIRASQPMIVMMTERSLVQVLWKVMII